MMRKMNSSGTASSPHSSRGAASRNASPEAKLSAFSPGDVRSRGFMEHGNGAGHPKGGFAQYPTSQGMPNMADPFTGPPSGARGGGMHLSPTASSFTPNGMNPVGFGPMSIDRSPSFMAEPPRSTMSYLQATSVPDTPGNGEAFAAQHGELGPIGRARTGTTPVAMMYCQLGQFDYENRNRAFAIEGVPKDLAYLTIVNIFDRREFGTLRGPVLTDLATHGAIYVGFSDSRDAKNAFDKVQKLHPEWRLHALTAKDFGFKFDAARVGSVSDFEGQIVASVFFNGHNPDLDGRAISYSFKDLVETFGDIKAFKTIPTNQANAVDFIAEFYDTRAAENVASTLGGSAVDECVLEVKLNKPDVVEQQAHHPLAEHNQMTPPESLARPPVSRRAGGFVHNSAFVELSPTGRSTIPIGDPASSINWTPHPGDGFAGRNRHDHGRFNDSRPNNNNQNHVDIERIRLGLDVRTTIMLRNIPNKIDQAMLKDIVDETSFGKYDFMYLRIDFANNCNVGYAFINFEDPIDIIDFAAARAGNTWNCFNSDKIAEISYATIQGKDCLVQKFRNSSVMLEHPSFRPKIFHTGASPLTGTEDRFPGPDNPSKMRRSVENAEHVGLFAPRVGQQYRDEQRRRRSQFDRGTIAAERETTFVRNATHSRRTPPRYIGTGNNMFSPTPNRSWYGTPFSGNRRA